MQGRCFRRAYVSLPHCVRVAKEEGDVAPLLDALKAEMERRFKALEEQHVRHVDKLASPLPHLLLVVDELATVTLGLEGKENIVRLERLAQLGRSAGIHLILATQRPTARSLSRLPVRCGTNKSRRKKRPRQRLWRPGSCPQARRRVSREAWRRPSGQATFTLSCNKGRLSSVGLARRCLVSCSRLLPGLQACFNGCGRWRRGCFRARGGAGGRGESSRANVRVYPHAVTGKVHK